MRIDRFSRWIALASIIASLLALAACGDGGEPVDVDATVVAAVSATVEARTTSEDGEPSTGEPSALTGTCRGHHRGQTLGDDLVELG